MDPAALADAVREIVEPRIGLELQWTLRGDDDDPRCSWMLALAVIVEAPGEHHSRYSTIEIARFEAELLDRRQEAHRIAAAVAAATDLTLHARPLEELGGQGDSAWIRAQPTGVPAAYALRWEARWWTDDGVPVDECGTEHVEATSGCAADSTLHRELERRFPRRPLAVRVRGGWRYGGVTSVDAAPWPTALPDRERVLDIALTEGCRPSLIAGALVARAPDVTALELMVVFQDSFHLWLDTLVPLAEWRRAEIDDAALDSVLAERIAMTRERWDRPRRLREADAARTSISRTVRDELRNMQNGSVVEVIVAVREVFDLELGDAKMFVDDCRDPRRDAALDALIRQRRRR
jgi:hypothetical protein